LRILSEKTGSPTVHDPVDQPLAAQDLSALRAEAFLPGDLRGGLLLQKMIVEEEVARSFHHLGLPSLPSAFVAGRHVVRPDDSTWEINVSFKDRMRKKGKVKKKV
jgi:hypothetical protein